MNNLLELKDLLVKNGKSLGAAAVIGAALAAGGSLLMKNVYTADAKLMVPTSSNSTLNGLVASIAGGANPMRNPADTYIGLLRSRTVLDAVIESQKLSEAWGAASKDDLRDRLSSSTKAYLGKDNLIHVEVTTPNPETSRDLANAMAQALLSGSSRLGITEASARRAFLEEQLAKVSRELQQAEENLKAVRNKTGILNLQSDAQADYTAAASLEARIAAKEGLLAGLKQSATSNNPDVVQAQAELDVLKARYNQLREFEFRGNLPHGEPLQQPHVSSRRGCPCSRRGFGSFSFTSLTVAVLPNTQLASNSTDGGRLEIELLNGIVFELGDNLNRTSGSACQL